MLKWLCGLIILANLALASHSYADTKEVAVLELPVPMVMKIPEGQNAKLTSGLVKRNEKFLSVPFAYRRTGELRETIHQFNLFSKRVIINAGAQGYWAGHFKQTQTSGYGANGKIGETIELEIWCFFENPQVKGTKHACVFQSLTNSDVFEPVRSPFVLEYFFQSGGSIITNKAVIEERPLDFGGPLFLDYTLVCVKKKVICIDISVNGNKTSYREVSIDAEGNGVFVSPIGKLKFKTDYDAATIDIYYDDQAKLAPKAKSLPSDAEKQKFLLDQANLLAFKAKDYDNRKAYEVLFGERSAAAPEFVKAKRFDLIATESFTPAKLYTQKNSPLNRPERFGPVGAVLYEIHIGGELPTPDKLVEALFGKPLPISPPRALVCWIEYDKLAIEVVKSQFFGYKSSCLEDKDGDKKYETLWKDVSFDPISLYSVTRVSTPAVLDGADGANPVEIFPLESAKLPSEKMSLYYMGASSETFDEKGNLVSDAVKFEWRYNSLEHDKTPGGIIDQVEILIDEKGHGILKDDNGNTRIEVKNFKPDGTAEIYFNDYHKQGIRPLVDYAQKAKMLRETEALLRDVAAEIVKPNGN